MTMTNKEFVDYISKNCKDSYFVQAVEGFYMDSKNELESPEVLKNRENALKVFAKRVVLDSDGLPNVDEVVLLDLYEFISNGMEYDHDNT